MPGPAASVLKVDADPLEIAIAVEEGPAIMAALQVIFW